MKKIIKIILLILWLIFIFYMSNQTGSASNKYSDVFVNSSSKIFNIDLHTLTVIIRKTAHILEYLVLFILIYINIKECKIKRVYSLSILLSVLCSILDEIHQLFIFERSGSVLDVFIDLIGILFGYILIKLINRKNN